jgi:hypothetical protein
MYNFKLYQNWCDAALKLNLDIRSKDGGCLWMVDPKTDKAIGKSGTAEQQFFWMLWTPLNKLGCVFNDLEGKGGWNRALDTLKHNHDDFHIEASKYHCDDDSHYNWFPEINHKPQDQISVDDIVACVRRIQDVENHSREQLMATMRTTYEDE